MLITSGVNPVFTLLFIIMSVTVAVITDDSCFDVLTSNISFIQVPKTEKCDVTASNGILQSANSRQGHMT
jgi:hypothetical protein